MKNLEKLLEGYRQFREGRDAALYERLSEGQSPKTLIISCCDSRVDPALVTQAPAGNLFVVRNVANLVPPFNSGRLLNSVGAAMEYAVCVLQVRHIVVMGHSQCGGIKAMVEGGVEGTDCIAGWVAQAASARSMAETRLAEGKADDLCQAAEQSSILCSLEHLMSYPWIAERVNANNLFVHGWYFDINSGVLKNYQADHDVFEAI